MTQVAGYIADNAPDGRAPVKIGGVYHSTEQVYTDGDVANLQMDAAGRVLTANVNRELTVFASQTFPEGATNSADFTNLFAKGVRLYLDYTAEAGTSPTLDLKIQTKDPVTGNYFDMLNGDFVQTNAVGTDELTIHPSFAAEVDNVSIIQVLPLTWRMVATVGGTDTPTVTASVGGAYIL